MKAFEKRRRMAGQQGFTLIELLIVIAILGILAAVVVFAVGNVTDNANESACQIELRSIKTAVQAARAQGGGYPATLAALSPEWLEEAPDSATFSYNNTTGAVAAQNGGKYSNAAVTACNA